MQETEDSDWMVIVRWRGGRDNKPPKGEAIHIKGVSQSQAIAVALEMDSRLPVGCSTTYRALPTPSYLQ